MTGADRRLGRLLWLSVAAAIATIALKTTAWWLTGSVGLLSDAAESVVNLVAALIAVGALRWSSMPADDEHAYGHTKAEYFSAGAEGIMIFIAAVTITVAAVQRLLSPQPVEDVGVGLAVSALASVINLSVAVVLIRAGRAHRSIILEADGKHLLTDVWTSAGVILGVAAVAFTGWHVLDPLIALAVAANIAFTGSRLVKRSGGGLMDRALPPGEQGLINDALRPFQADGIVFHALRTRQAGSRSFVSLHVLVPGSWTVWHGHRTATDVESAIRAALPHASVFTHLEAIEDPLSYQDTGLDPEPTDAPEAPLHTAPPTDTDTDTPGGPP
ncbi:cation diffusion facilitator family transporter [Actinocorallia sp. API 0066]|uniref:cation diffusion facilitator family transporter n=1 Tax=Actinocorallia sp. API 0066 TaxID=2896846 RepID=UPI001E5EC6AF|nr:cation diffusion facilitator family transporter [Actinocorallia sp. API 0066]MCD0448613.1 cation diffusion facilitator family transporter [Actinocorallia sp. API 0066]